MRIWISAIGGIVFAGLALYEPLFLVAVLGSAGIVLVVAAVMRLRK